MAAGVTCFAPVRVNQPDERLMTRIYLDNAATSHPKPESVYQAVADALRSGGNAGRGGHAAGLAADRLVFSTRELLADFFGISDSSNIAFTLNATTALNTALFGLVKSGDRVVSGSMEHNAVSRPLRHLKDIGAEVVKVPADSRGRIDKAQIIEACERKKTRLLVLNHCSNVNGQLQNIEGIGAFCRENDILFVLDGSQSAGTFPIQVESQQIDCFAAPGHKNLCGPTGTGFLYVRPGLVLEPLTYGGTGANSHSDLPPALMPERLESGTQNLSGISGLKAALEYFQQQGIDNLRDRTLNHLRRIIEGLENIEAVTLYSADKIEHQGDALSFNIAGLDPSEVGFRLDHEFGICVRVGLHCAPDAHRSLGTFPEGTVRVSPGIFTRAEEIEKFLAAIQSISR